MVVRSPSSLWALFLFVWGCRAERAPLLTGFVDTRTADVTPRFAGRLATVKSREGDRVQAGQILASLVTEELDAAVDRAKAQVEQAQGQVQEAEGNLSSARPSVASAAADLRRAQASLLEAELNFNRVDRLYRQNLVSKADFDVAKAALDTARAAAQSLRAGIGTATGRERAAISAVSVAESALEAARAALAVAQSQRDDADLRAPFDGLVADRNLEVGEWAVPGVPVVTVEDVAHPWVRLDLEETRFGNIVLGTPGDVTLLAYPKQRYTGRVIEVGVQASFATERDVKRGRPDLRTFRIKVGFDHPSAELRPGLTAQVRFGAAAPSAPAAAVDAGASPGDGGP